MFTLLFFFLDLMVELVAFVCLTIVILIIPLAILYLILKKWEKIIKERKK